MFVDEAIHPENAYPCECGGVLEAEATGWINLTKGEGGKPVLELFGFSERDYSVKCSECEQEHTDTELGNSVGSVIYGNGGRFWFRG